jgi:hypothetical protein
MQEKRRNMTSGIEFYVSDAQSEDSRQRKWLHFCMEKHVTKMHCTISMMENKTAKNIASAMKLLVCHPPDTRTRKLAVCIAFS